MAPIISYIQVSTGKQGKSGLVLHLFAALAEKEQTLLSARDSM